MYECMWKPEKTISTLLFGAFVSCGRLVLSLVWVFLFVCFMVGLTTVALVGHGLTHCMDRQASKRRNVSFLSNKN